MAALLSARISTSPTAEAASRFDPMKEQAEDVTPPPRSRLLSASRRHSKKRQSDWNDASSIPSSFVPLNHARKSRKSLHKVFNNGESSLTDHPLSVCHGNPCTAPVDRPPDAAKDGDGDLVWRKLGVCPSELCLPLTLPTGQSFRWRQTGSSQFTGVLGFHLLSLRQTPDEIIFHLHNPQASSNPSSSATAMAAMRDYFNLDMSLVSLYKGFCEADERFAAVAPFMAGARLLRQTPVECLFQFICSSNNHIQRISHMVDHLSAFGPHLGTIDGHHFHAFPSLDQLAAVTEKQLRDAGFGYRAKYIVGTVQELSKKDGGGDNWLNSLKDQPLEVAIEALCTLPGIGPKVAACIALFSLDKHQAVPVDTHVWQIAVRYLMPELAGTRLSPKLHATVSKAFVDKFGQYAGWAQTVLFISELAAYQNLLPPHLQSPKSSKAARN